MPRKHQNTKKHYVAKKKRAKAEAKHETVKDMGQDYRINKIEKSVKQIVKANRNYQVIKSNSSNIDTVVGIGTNAFFTFGTQAVDLNTLSLTSGQVGGLVRFSTWKHIDLCYYLNQDIDATYETSGLGTIVRVMLVCIHSPNGRSNTEDASTQLMYSDVFALADSDASALTSADILKPYNRLKRSNIEILHDKFHKLGVPRQESDVPELINQSADQLQSNVFRFQIFPSKRSQAQTYNNYDEQLTNDFTNVSQNQYWLLYMCDNVDNTAPPTITYNVTLDYLL